MRLATVNFLIELCHVNGATVPISASRIAADALDDLAAAKAQLEKEAADAAEVAAKKPSGKK